MSPHEPARDPKKTRSHLKKWQAYDVSLGYFYEMKQREKGFRSLPRLTISSAAKSLLIAAFGLGYTILRNVLSTFLVRNKECGEVVTRAPGYRLLRFMEIFLTKKYYENILIPQFTDIQNDYFDKLDKGYNSSLLAARSIFYLVAVMALSLNPLNWLGKLLDLGKKVG